jgi:hypothetical protein
MHVELGVWSPMLRPTFHDPHLRLLSPLRHAANATPYPTGMNALVPLSLCRIGVVALGVYHIYGNRHYKGVKGRRNAYGVLWVYPYP